MEFIISKIFWMLAEPGNFLVLWFMVAAILLFRPKHWHWGRRMIIAATVLMLALRFTPLSNLILSPLENRFPLPNLAGKHIDGVVVLGGVAQTELSFARSQVALSDTAERLTEMAILAQLYPEAVIVFTSGSAALTNQEEALREADAVRPLMEKMGLKDRILYERNSRNTQENIAFTKELVQPKPNETWLLVTSARHLPRAVGLARQQEWDIVPYPVDYLTPPPGSAVKTGDFTSELSKFSAGIREWIGLVAYRLLGKIDTFFPAP